MAVESPAIKTESISKTFRGTLKNNEVRALVDVSLEVSPGEIFGLLGPNGAGKTTLVKILLGALHPTTGRGTIGGLDISTPAARRQAGFLPENHRFPSYLTGRQFLYVFGGMAGLTRARINARIDHLLEMVRMSQWRHTRISKYSKGMAQRIGLAQALLNDPEFIFLDEPTDGVDPIGRKEIRDILIDLKRNGKTIFLNSHLLAEVESVCDRVAILDRGRLIKVGPIAGLIDQRPTYRIETGGLPDDLAASLRDEFADLTADDSTLTVIIDDTIRLNDLIDRLRRANIEIRSIIPQKISLEDSFMQLVRGARNHD